MSRPIITLCSLIALAGCVPEIRTSPEDVPDGGAVLDSEMDVSTDRPRSEDATDGGDLDRPGDVLLDVNGIDVPTEDISTQDDGSVDSEVPTDHPTSADVMAPIDASTDVIIDAAQPDRSCGSCVAANAVAICAAGTCRIDHCNSGYGDCNSQYSDGCETALNSLGNCGRCGDACGAAGLCVGGRCVTQRSCPMPGERGCGIVSSPGASFQLGSPEASTGEPLVGQVSVSSMLVDTHEVTVARFRRFWVAGHPATTVPVHYPGGADVPVGMVREPLNSTTGSACNWTVGAGAREAHPINCIDWSTAQNFCVWDGARLPTEAELEYLSRIRSVAGLASPRRFPWGDDNPVEMFAAYPRPTPCERAQFQSCAGEDGALTRRVGSFSGAGSLFDLSGNIAEWAADVNAMYGDAPCWGPTPVDLHDPVCAAASSSRSVRGGSFRSGAAAALLGASRDSRSPMSVEDDVGFRCVRSP